MFGGKGEGDAPGDEHARRNAAHRISEFAACRSRLTARKQRREDPRKCSHITDEGETAQEICTLIFEGCRRQRQHEQYAPPHDKADGGGQRIIQGKHCITCPQRRPERCRQGDAQPSDLALDRAHRTVKQSRVRTKVIENEKIEIDDHTPSAAAEGQRTGVVRADAYPSADLALIIARRSPCFLRRLAASRRICATIALLSGPKLFLDPSVPL